MKNILDYVKKYKHKSFEEFKFNEVDGLILCQLSYLNYDDFIPNIEQNKESISLNSYLDNEDNILKLCKDTIDSKNNKKLLRILKDSKRYQGLYMNYFYNKFLHDEIEQLCAMCYIFDEFIFIAYRGTDITLIGWKEDFYMALMDAVPSQIDATKYLNLIGEKESKLIYLGGHSKGGNLALFSAMNCNRNILKRVIQIFNYDGPGFNKDVYDLKEYLEIEHLMIKLTCEQAMIGILMYHSEEMFFVKARGYSILQHNPYNWKITKDGKFKLVKYPVLMSRVFEKTVRDFLEHTSIIERKRFIDLVFVILMENNKSTIFDIKRRPISYSRGIKARFKVLEPRRKKFLKLMLKRYHVIWNRNLKHYLTIKYKFGNKKMKNNLHNRNSIKY